MKRLDVKEWEKIFKRLEYLVDSEYYDGFVDWVEVTWLDPGDGSEGEWCLNFGEELFEDGFKTEKEAQDRLNYLEQQVYKGLYDL